MTSKRDFGSFHSSNVQELLSKNEEEYIHPELPFEPTHFKNTNFEFGSSLKRNHFLLEDECTFLNHGAFGAVLKDALHCTQKWQNYIERQPLRFFDRELLPHLVHVTRRLANFVHGDAKDLILVPNVTTAVNCVLRSQNLQKGDRVFLLSVEYGAVKKIIRHICEESDSLVQEETVSFPLNSKQKLLDIVQEKLQPGTKLAVFDHIPSNTPYILPVREICSICHSKGVPVLIDGAHALGQLDLNIESFGDVDFYVSNAHKWLCAPKGCAFMYVNKKHQASTKSLIISHGIDSGFNSQFIWTGLKDYSPWLAMHTVLDFWEAVGPEKIRRYIHSLAQEAGRMLIEKWNTDLLVSEDLTGSLLCVRLPREMYQDVQEVDYSKAEIVQNALYHDFNIEVPIKAVQGHLYVRLSAHIYNHMAEYEYLASAVLSLAKENILKGM